jgi:hypothetical protein
MNRPKSLAGGRRLLPDTWRRAHSIWLSRWSIAQLPKLVSRAAPTRAITRSLLRKRETVCFGNDVIYGVLRQSPLLLTATFRPERTDGFFQMAAALRSHARRREPGPYCQHRHRQTDKHLVGRFLVISRQQQFTLSYDVRLALLRQMRESFYAISKRLSQQRKRLACPSNRLQRSQPTLRWCWLRFSPFSRR